MQAYLREALTGGQVKTISEVNNLILAKCQELYPKPRTIPNKPSMSPAVIRSVDRMWCAHHELHQREAQNNLRGMINTYRKVMQFQQASRALKRESRSARRAWFEEQILSAEQAARKHDLGAVYKVVNTLAPKRRREQVRIRGAQGELLSPVAEFDAIFEYYRDAFSAPPVCSDRVESSHAQISFRTEDIVWAIQQLKDGKAVPDASLPAEGAEDFADLLATQLNAESRSACPFPAEVTDCRTNQGAARPT